MRINSAIPPSGFHRDLWNENESRRWTGRIVSKANVQTFFLMCVFFFSIIIMSLCSHRKIQSDRDKVHPNQTHIIIHIIIMLIRDPFVRVIDQKTGGS